MAKFKLKLPKIKLPPLKKVFKIPKGGMLEKVGVGLANAAASNFSGGLVQNLFKVSSVKKADDAVTTNNANAAIAAVGAGVGTFKALYQPSQEQISLDAANANSPFSGPNATSTLTGSAQKSFFAQYWAFILAPFALIMGMYLFKKN